MFFVRSTQIATFFGVAAILAACGGGGDGGADASPSGSSGTDAEGRVAYRWTFDSFDGAQVVGATVQPTGVSGREKAANICILNSTLCKVDQVPGRQGKALRFKPEADESYVWFMGGRASSGCSGNLLSFNPFGDFNADGKFDHRMTVAMWVKADRIEPESTYHLFGTQDPVEFGADAGFHLRLVNGVPTISLYPDEAFSWDPDFVLEAPSALRAGVWHHLAVTYNIITTTLYVDGVAVASAPRFESTTVMRRSKLNESCEPYFLGGLTARGFTWPDVERAKSSGLGYVFPGVIDEFIFSNRVFGADQIKALFDEPVSSFN